MAARPSTFASRSWLAAALALAVLGPALVQPALAQDAAPDEEAAPSEVPNGNDCAAVIARWQDFAGRENKGGHMGLSVYNQIQNEIDRADHLCQAGQDAQARKAVAESKRRHGYQL